MSTVPNQSARSLTQWTPEAIEKLDLIVSESHGLHVGDKGLFTKAFKVSSAIQRVRDALTPEVMQYVMGLQGSSLGFRTDQDGKAPYPVEVVRDCFIEATLRGAYPVDNEWNIIAGRCYLALNFFRRKLRPENLPGLTDLKLSAEVPEMKDGGARVAYRSSWKWNGEPQELNRLIYKLPKSAEHPEGLVVDERIPIRVNSGMIVDAVLGKAERKMRAMILARITAQDQDDAEPEFTTVVSQGPAVGRTSLLELPRTEYTHAAEQKTPPRETKPAKPETKPAASESKPEKTESDADDLQNLIATFEERIDSARKRSETAKINEDLVEAREQLGEKVYTRLSEGNDMRDMQIQGEQRDAAKATVKRK